MPFCPQCKYEYKPEIKTCPECELDLLDELEEKETDTTYVEIYSVSNRMESDVVRFLLEENQIDYLVRDLRSFPVLPDFGRRADLRIAVVQGSEDKARGLLRSALEDGALTAQGDFL